MDACLCRSLLCTFCGRNGLLHDAKWRCLEAVVGNAQPHCPDFGVRKSGSACLWGMLSFINREVYVAESMLPRIPLSVTNEEYQQPASVFDSFAHR